MEATSEHFNNTDQDAHKQPAPDSPDAKHKLWMDFDDFMVCFKSIVVYHKPSAYKFSEKYSDLRQVTPLAAKDKKKETSNALAQLPPLVDEKSPRLLFVDSLSPIELVVSLQSMSRWYEQRIEAPEKAANRPGKNTKADSVALIESGELSGAMIGGEFGIGPFREFSPLAAGSLTAEAYSWKSVVSGQPLLRIHTTAIRSSYLRLPPGRHVIRLSVSVPIAFHMHVVSNCRFTLGDEEDLMPKVFYITFRFNNRLFELIRFYLASHKN